MRELGFFVVEPVLDLPLVLYYASRVLGLRDSFKETSAPVSNFTCEVPTRLSRYRNTLFWIIVLLQFRYSPGNSRLLSRRKLILAALASGLCCGALFVPWVDGDFRRVVAGVDDVGPSWRY